MTPNTTAEQEAQTMDSPTTASPRRIKDAKAAFAQMGRLIKSDDTRAKARAKIKGMVDGERPYSEKELFAKGMGWRYNVNWREAEGIVDGVTGSYPKLVMDVAELVDVNILPEAELPDSDGSLGRIIAEEYPRIMVGWRKFLPNYSIMVGQFGRYGRGLYFWADPTCWKYSAIKTGNHLIPEGASVMLEDHQVLMVRDSMSPVRLYTLAENESASSLGWNTDAIKRALVQMYKKPEKKLSDHQIASEYEQLRAKIASRDLGLDDEAFKDMPVCFVMEKALDGGKVRMTIISAAQEPDEYLFEKDDVYDDFYQCAAMFVYNYAEGDIHSVKGLGERSYAHVEAGNRLLNNALDGSTMVNSLLVSGNTEAVTDVMKIARIGPITVIPDALNVVQQNFQPRLDTSIALRDVISASLNNNTGVNKSQPESTGPVERTAAGVKYRRSKEVNFSTNQVLLFYSQWDSFHIEMMRRLLNPNYPEGWDGYKEANLMRKRCEARGVPVELLDAAVLEVKTHRAIGSSSMLTEEEATNGLLQLASSMPETGSYNALRDRGAYLVGASNVNRYFPTEANNATTNEHSIAQLENNDLLEGSVVIVGGDQKHTIHLDIHLRKMVEMAEIYREQPEQVDVMALARFFIASVEHATEHNAIAANNPVLKDDAAVYAETIMALAQVRDELQRDAEELMSQQAAASEQAQSEASAETDPELRMKLERHALDMQIKTQQATSSIQLKEQMQAHTIRMREIKEAHRLQLQRNQG